MLKLISNINSRLIDVSKNKINKNKFKMAKKMTNWENGLGKEGVVFPILFSFK